jgi:hypothetical protein
MDWQTPDPKSPRFRGAAWISRDPDTGLYRGQATIAGRDYELRATVTERDGRKGFAIEAFEEME